MARARKAQTGSTELSVETQPVAAAAVHVALFHISGEEFIFIIPVNLLSLKTAFQ
jgi:hypothetical protein